MWKTSLLFLRHLKSQISGFDVLLLLLAFFFTLAF